MKEMIDMNSRSTKLTIPKKRQNKRKQIKRQTLKQAKDSGRGRMRRRGRSGN
jgi:hypothetical protein